MPPKVSIVTCSHNRPELLRAAIESLRAQTDPDWEHLIYDDFSTDRKIPAVLSWAMQDSRVRVWRGQENLDRPAVLWNFMLDRAHGRYFTVLDDDNEKLPKFIARMAGELDLDPSLDVVTCGWRVDAPDRVDNYFLNLSTTAERLETLSTCDGGAMLYRREHFERAGYFSEAIRTNEDWDWLRRAVHTGKIKNLHEVHSTYRSHNKSRMTRSKELGNDADVLRVKARPLAQMLGVDCVYPPFERLTASQKDVCTNVADALAGIQWGAAGRDLSVVISPFQLSNEDVANQVRGFPRALSLHMEDPYALATNLERVQTMSRLCETWVCTNDASTVEAYRKIVGQRVIVCPLLSAAETIAPTDGPRHIDVLLCGYAYPSRKRFMAELLPLIRNHIRIKLVGDGWQDFAYRVDTFTGVEVLPTQPVAETYALHARARAVVCLHRVHGDCSDGPVEPLTVNRGFMEGFSGPRVFVDRTRPLHSLDEGDVVWYSSPQELADLLFDYLKDENRAAADALQVKCKQLYTYHTRLSRILNCVRAPRYLAEIP